VLGPRRGVHLEVFAANRVVLIPAGLGTRPPRRYSAGRISAARCFADLITIEPTGVILLRPGSRRTLGDVFRSWGQPLSTRRVASFAAGRGSHVVLYVDGQRRPGSPGALRLRPHMEIVLEVGPHVPPHRTYRFPPGT
jgi:hypothetical protein